MHLCLLSLSVQCGVARRSVGVKLVKLQQGQRAERPTGMNGISAACSTLRPTPGSGTKRRLCHFLLNRM